LSEDAYALVAFLTVLAYAAVLWHRWRQGQAVRRLMRLLKEQEAGTTDRANTNSEVAPSKSDLRD
jgi:hypothetical protein